ncbi:hypothetical protein QFZ80_004694 [Paenibacillus sp. V4I7]|nr:hypothetical protein [Paenibacillus sp. V4I7]
MALALIVGAIYRYIFTIMELNSETYWGTSAGTNVQGAPIVLNLSSRSASSNGYRWNIFRTQLYRRTSIGLSPFFEQSPHIYPSRRRKPFR